MKAIALMYHDAIDASGADGSGFPGRAAARYKLERGELVRHLDALAEATSGPPGDVRDVLAGRVAGRSWLLTFDDGGASAAETAAELARRGWIGHFLVTTDYVGRPAFLTRAQIRELRDLGHVVGTHSASHPERISACSDAQLLSEWRQSAEMLAGVLGEPIVVASVPGGYYAPNVARAAAAAGIRALFTSEPTTVVKAAGSVRLVGRYTVMRGNAPRRAAMLAAGRPIPRVRQRASWGLRKLAKRAAGPSYVSLRRAILDRSPYTALDRDA
jgi:peptidoglycan/xylan/chitin deacetylase (PgdA/CDA1 family)